MKNKNNQRGITLIALVITIIVLLILAGISIASLTGSGLFSQVQRAKQEQENAQIKEETTLADHENKIGEYINGDRNTLVQDYTTNLAYKLNLNNLNGQSGVTINGSGVTVSEDKKYISFDGQSYIAVSATTVDPNSELVSQPNSTMCCWYRTDEPTQSQWGKNLVALGEQYGKNNPKTHILMIGTNTIGGGQTGNLISKFIDPINLNDGNWHFLAATWSNNNTIVTYYDGVPFKSTGTYTTTSSLLHIGGTCLDIPTYYAGDLADVRVYKEALTENELKQIYEYGKQYLGIK